MRRVDWMCVGLGRVAGQEVLSGFVVVHGRSVVGSGCTCRVDWLFVGFVCCAIVSACIPCFCAVPRVCTNYMVCVFAPVALHLVKS